MLAKKSAAALAAALFLTSLLLSLPGCSRPEDRIGTSQADASAPSKTTSAVESAAESSAGGTAGEQTAMTMTTTPAAPTTTAATVTPTTTAPTAAPTTAAPVRVEGITLSTYAVSLTVGQSKMPIVTMTPENAADKGEIWTSSDTGVAAVSSLGNITGIAAGSCTVTVTSHDNPAVSAVVEVTVTRSVRDEQDRQAREIAQQIADSIGPGTDLERVGQAAQIVSGYYQRGIHKESGDNYYRPYGVFIAGESSCAGTTRALGLVLECMGYSWEHVNENQWAHQWCRLTMDGQTGWADGQIGWVGYGDHPLV